MGSVPRPVDRHLNHIRCVQGLAAEEVNLHGGAARALDITGDFITPAFTFIATSHALHWSGAAPLFADLLPFTYDMDPEWIEAIYGVAKSSQELQKWEDAVISYRRVLQIDSTVPEAYFGLSEIYEGLGRPSQAVGLLRQGLAFAPDDTAATRRLERLLAEGGAEPRESAPEGP